MSSVWWRRLRQNFGLAITGRIAFTVTQWFCAWHLFAEYIGGPRIVSGPSMLPTMTTDACMVLEDCFSHRLSPPRIARGDLVTLLSPIDPEKTVCKRVIGLPGDTICVDPTKALREGGEDECRQRPWGPDHVLVPPGHIWIAGDNTALSRDSRTYGPVPMALVRGRIFARLYPDPRWFRNPVVYID